MKTILIEFLHRRVAIAGLQATWPAMVSSLEREEMGRRRAGGGGRLQAVGEKEGAP
jgi:hypothetical protein